MARTKTAPKSKGWTENRQRMAIMMIAKHGSASEKARLKKAIETAYPQVRKKMDEGGPVDNTKKKESTSEGGDALGTIGKVGGVISDAYGLLSQVKNNSDYAKTDQFGGMVDAKKFVTGDRISSIIDPFTAGMDQWKKGNTLNAALEFTGLGTITDLLGITHMSKDKVEEANKQAARNRQTIITGRANQSNITAGQANNNRLANINQGLKKGGVVKRRRMVTGGETESDSTLVGYTKKKPVITPAKPQNRINPYEVKKLAKGGIVTGKGGIDTNNATLKENSFVIPVESVDGKVRSIAKKLGLYKPLKKASGGNVKVALTRGELIVPPEKRTTFERMYGASLDSLAPNADNTNQKDTGGDIEELKFLRGKQNKTKSELNRIDELESNAGQKVNQLKTRAEIKWGDKNFGKAKNTGINSGNNPQSMTLKDVLERNSQEQTKMIAESKGGKNVKTPTTKNSSKDNNHAMESITGAIQGITGVLGTKGLGDAPVKDIDRLLNEDEFNPGNTILGLNTLRQTASYGFDPKVKAALLRRNNEAKAMDIALSNERSAGSATTRFNQNQAANVNKMNADVQVEGQDAQLMDEKKGKYGQALIGSDPFLASLAEGKQRRKLAGVEMKQRLWDDQSKGYSALIGAGFANIMESQRANKFWDQYKQYLNPTA